MYFLFLSTALSMKIYIYEKYTHTYSNGKWKNLFAHLTSEALQSTLKFHCWKYKKIKANIVKR